MINVKKAIEFIEKTGKSSFDEIWEANKDFFKEEFPDAKEESLKTDLYLSLGNDERVLILYDENSNQVFDFAAKYKYSEINKIKTSIFGEVVDKQMEEDALILEEENKENSVPEKN